MLCGNKTDECPNCNKFIRRAVFAYHYENNCTNLNEPEADARLTSGQTNTISTFQLNNASGLATKDKSYISTLTTNIPVYSMANGNTSQGSNLGTLSYYFYNLIRILFLKQHEQLFNVHIVINSAIWLTVIYMK